MWTHRNGSCVSSVTYFCFMVLQTGVKKTTTTYHKVPTSESDLFVFLDFSLWTCPGRIYTPPSLWEWAWLSYLPQAPGFVFNAHSCSAAVHQLIHPQQKESNPPSALCFSGVSNSVSQTWAWILWEFFSLFSLSAISVSALAAPLFLLFLSCPLTVMICSPNPISLCINARFEALLSRLFAPELISLSHNKKMCKKSPHFTACLAKLTCLLSNG